MGKMLRKALDTVFNRSIADCFLSTCVLRGFIFITRHLPWYIPSTATTHRSCYTSTPYRLTAVQHCTSVYIFNSVPLCTALYGDVQYCTMVQKTLAFTTAQYCLMPIV